MLLLNPPPEPSRHRNPLPNLNAPEGFQPVVPIPVVLARDEALLSDSEDENDMEHDLEKEKEKVTPPPPAYGLWRSSVRVDPNLLHWQRVDENRAQSAISMPRSSRATGSVVAAAVHDSPAVSAANERLQAETETGPRPPSYVSEDGVSYVTEAMASQSAVVAPLNVGAAAQQQQPPPVHPAWRASYVMSEIRPGEVPSSVNRR